MHEGANGRVFNDPRIAALDTALTAWSLYSPGEAIMMREATCIIVNEGDWEAAKAVFDELQMRVVAAQN